MYHGLWKSFLNNWRFKIRVFTFCSKTSYRCGNLNQISFRYENLTPNLMRPIVLNWFSTTLDQIGNRLLRYDQGTLAIVPILQVLVPLWCSPLAAIHDDEDAAASKDEEAAGAGKIEPPKMFSYCFIILLLLDHTVYYPNVKNQYVEM